MEVREMNKSSQPAMECPHLLCPGRLLRIGKSAAKLFVPRRLRKLVNWVIGRHRSRYFPPPGCTSMVSLSPTRNNG